MTEKINHFTKKDFPEEWDDLINDWVDIVKEHRKYGTFYANMIIKIDKNVFPESPEMYGYWMSNTFYWSDSDYDPSEIHEFFRCEKQEITVTDWVRVD